MSHHRRRGQEKYYGQGLDEGRAEEAARALLTAIRVRGLTLSEPARERILAEKDLSVLQARVPFQHPRDATATSRRRTPAPETSLRGGGLVFVG